MATVHKSVVAEVGDGLEYVLSDETVDRYGDVIQQDGWNLRNFKQNAIALFNHNSNAPIGKWTNVHVDGGKLKGRLVFAAPGTSPRIDELRGLAEQGILRATSVGFRPLEEEPLKGGRGVRYLKSELLEVSLVSVPANPSALQLARSLNISDDTLRTVFGEHADLDDGMRRRGSPGELAAIPPIRKKPMSTLSKRIEDAQTELVAKRDKLIELNGADALDLDAIEELNDQIDGQERALVAMKSSEAKLAGSKSLALSVAAPALARRPLGVSQHDVSKLDLLVRSALVKAVSMFGGKSLDQVLDERYPGHEATYAVTKADQTIGTTTVAGWVLELQQTSYAAFVDALRPKSIYPDLRDRGMGLSFDSSGTAYIPSLTAGGANGSFFGEGLPMRVGRITTAATTMTPKKLGVIIPFSREAAKRSTPDLEGLVRRAIVADTAKVIDQTMLDAVAASAIRPAGLLNGVAATASGFGGGDYTAVMEDISALMAPFDAADASDGITLIMHPAQARRLAMMPGPGDGNFGWASPLLSEFNILRSTNVTAGRLIALRNEDFVTAIGDSPDFEMSNTATIHMEDTTPLEIVSGTGPTTADPVRSFFQTDTMGVRMVMDISWMMRRTGMIRWIDGTSW